MKKSLSKACQYSLYEAIVMYNCCEDLFVVFDSLSYHATCIADNAPTADQDNEIAFAIFLWIPRAGRR